MALVHGPSSAGLYSGRWRAKRPAPWRPLVKAVCCSAEAPAAVGSAPDVVTEDPTAAGPQAAATAAAAVRSFAELGVDPVLLNGLQSLRIRTPVLVQQHSIPEILKGANCAIQSFTGSGKTLAYLLPILTMALQRYEDHEMAHGRGSTNDSAIQALIVCPGQDLCMQIVRLARALLPSELHAVVQQCIGGANQRRQIEALKEGRPVVVVGTPGRVANMLRTGALQLHKCGALVLDEVDQLITPIFKEDMDHIVSHCGRKLDRRQTVLASATLTPYVVDKTAAWCAAPTVVSLNPPAAKQPRAGAAGGGGGRAAPREHWGWDARPSTGPSGPSASKGTIGGVQQASLVPAMPPGLSHYFLVAPQQHRVDAVRKWIHALGLQRVLVFMNWQKRVKDTQYKLEASGMKVASLHGGMGKFERQATLNNFQKGTYRALVVNDVAARGIDIPDCDGVVHLELPSNAAHYCHRAGRTGRMGAQGTVLSIVTPGDIFVTDKMAVNLQIPVKHVHLSNGQMVEGPDDRFKDRQPSENALIDGKTRKGQHDKARLEENIVTAGNGRKKEGSKSVLHERGKRPLSQAAYRKQGSKAELQSPPKKGTERQPLKRADGHNKSVESRHDEVWTQESQQKTYLRAQLLKELQEIRGHSAS